MKKISVVWMVVALAMMMVPGVVLGQNKWKSPQDKLMAKEAAISDAYRKLAEQVKGLHIEAETYVRDFVTESDEIEKSVDAFIRHAKLGTPRYFADGICEIDAELKLQTIITELEKIVNGKYKGNKFNGTSFQKITQNVKIDVIAVTGSGALREEGAAPAEPGGNPLPAAGGRNAGVWARVPANQKLMAAEAARADCYRKIGEQVVGAQIDARTTVRDFVAESDEIIKSLRANLRFVKLDEPRWLEDGIVEVHGSVNLRQVLTMVEEIVNTKYKDNRAKIDLWQKVTVDVKDYVIEATGSGAAKVALDPIDGPGVPVDDVDIDIPAWARQVYRATGKAALGTDETKSEAQRKLMAEQGALTDGRRKLLEYVKGLSIDARTTVSDFVTQSDQINAEVSGVITGSRQDGQAKWAEDGICEVNVVLDLKEVWKIVQARYKFNR